VATPPSGENPLGRKQRLLLEVERFSRRHYGLVFFLSFLSLVAASWLGSHLRLESDVLQLIPKGNRQVDTFREALRDFGSIDYLMVLLEAGQGEGVDELEDFADVYAEKLLDQHDLVESVEYRFQPDARFLELFTQNALLFLPPSELPEIARSLTDEQIGKQIRANRVSLASPTATLTEGLVVHDPLGLMSGLVGRLLSHRGALKIDLSDGYYVAEDGRALLLLVKPVHPSQNLEFDRKLLEASRSAEAATREELAAEGGETPKIAAVLRNGLISFFAVTGLYWLCYRRFAALFYSTVPLLVGQALTFAAAYFVIGSLNSASSALPALLMGLGTDFTIVMYARYVEERQGGATIADATEAMVGETGLGVFTGVITSAGTFYAMCISGFRGLNDLGLLIGTGILLCGVAIVFLLPAMITWNEGVRKRKVDPIKRLHLQSFGLERLIPFSARHRTAVVTVVVILAAIGGLLATRLGFDDTLSSLRSNRSESAKVQEEITKRFGASLSYMMAIAEAPTVDEAVALAQKVQTRLQPFLANGTVGTYESILTYLPPVAQQEKTIEALRAGADGPFDAARIEATFSRALDENGFRKEPFEEYLGRMEKFLSPTRPLTLDDLENKGLGRLVDRYVHRSPGRVRIVTYLYPTDPRWKRTAPPGLVDALTDGDQGIVVSGTNVIGQELRALFSRDATLAVLLGLGVVLILLILDFRSLKLTAIAMAQLLTGVLMMLGVMKLLGMSINYANAFVATMIMGVGIDYSIHLIHRLRLSDPHSQEGLLETGKAVVMAALTNVAGFGTLTLGSYPAMRSLGAVALCGSITCLLTSLTLVPALMGGVRSSQARSSTLP
jgi:predicted RND superfamily exporter protein